MTITAKIIADSVSPEGKRLTTFELRYPRFIHAEFMTHRMLSRSASSSRAIPVSKVIRSIIDDPAEPVSWGSNQHGMQAGEDLSGWRLWLVRRAWFLTRYAAIGAARVAIFAGLHKQVANRILEPWSHISVVATATDWKNFFALRCHKDADPTFQLLAWKICHVYETSEPVELARGEWHLPYVTVEERRNYASIDYLKRFSAARCARVSYNNHDGSRPDTDKDLTLCERLMGSPVHASPFEHQGTPDQSSPELHGNFDGFIQYRKQIPNEAVIG